MHAHRSTLRPAACARRVSALLLPLVLAAATGGHAAAQAIPVARADGLGGFELWTTSAGGPALLLGSGLHFRTMELAGRTYRDHLRIDLPSLGGVGSPAPHVRLPGGGSVFVVDAAGATVLLHVNSSGALSVGAVQAAGTVQPTIAVATDGSRALLATSLAAGGDVLLADLSPGASAAALNLTASQPPLDVDASSLRTSSRRAFFLAGGRLWRADLEASGAGALAAPVALAVDAGDVLLPETVLSADGRSLAVESVAPSGLARLHVVTPDGIPVLLTPSPVTIDAPQLLSPLGPMLALSDDGTLAGWRETIAGSKEVFLQDVPQPGPPPPAPVQLTANAFFTDTLDNAGILGFASHGVLTFVTGEAGTAAVGAADLFTAKLGALGGGPVLQNATATSGVTVPPFLVPGDLEITSAQLDPLAERMLFVVDPNGADSGLFATAADGSGPGTMLLSNLKSDPVMLRAGASIFAETTPDAAQQKLTELRLIRPASSLGQVQFLGVLPKDLSLDRFVDSDDGARAAFVVSAGPTAPALQLPVRLDVTSGTLAPAWTQLFQVSPLLSLPPTGALVAGVGDAGGPYLTVAFTGFSQGSVLAVPAGFTFPLPY